MASDKRTDRADSVDLEQTARSAPKSPRGAPKSKEPIVNKRKKSGFSKLAYFTLIVLAITGILSTLIFVNSGRNGSVDFDFKKLTLKLEVNDDSVVDYLLKMDPNSPVAALIQNMVRQNTGPFATDEKMFYSIDNPVLADVILSMDKSNLIAKRLIEARDKQESIFSTGPHKAVIRSAARLKRGFGAACTGSDFIGKSVQLVFPWDPWVHEILIAGQINCNGSDNPEKLFISRFDKDEIFATHTYSESEVSEFFLQPWKSIATASGQ